MKKLYPILFIILIAVSCDLLTTRDPEEPSASSSSYIAATSPDILFSNFTNSFDEKVVENYLACFADEATLDIPYVFVASASSVAQYPGLMSWDLDAERMYFNNVVTASGSNAIQLVLSNESMTSMGDSALYFYDYSLSFNSEVYAGSVEFTIHQDSRSQWFITTWKDYEISGASSWSQLKGKYN